MKYTFDHTILLHLALQKLGTTLADFERQCYSQAQLNKATHMMDSETTYSVDGETTRIAKESLWRTPTAIVKTTRYGRVKGVEWIHKPKDKKSKPARKPTQPQPQQPKTQPTITIKRSKLHAR